MTAQTLVSTEQALYLSSRSLPPAPSWLPAFVPSTCRGSRKLGPASIITYRQNKKWLAKVEGCFVVSNVLLSLLEMGSWTRWLRKLEGEKLSWPLAQRSNLRCCGRTGIARSWYTVRGNSPLSPINSVSPTSPFPSSPRTSPLVLPQSFTFSHNFPFSPLQPQDFLPQFFVL